VSKNAFFGPFLQKKFKNSMQKSVNFCRINFDNFRKIAILEKWVQNFFGQGSFFDIVGTPLPPLFFDVLKEPKI
jgi:hypothetical protein